MSQGTLLVLGGRSDIGLAVARLFAADGYDLQLAARNCASLTNVQADLQLRHGVTVSLLEFDVLAPNSHQAFVDALFPLPAIALCAIGLLGDQAADERAVDNVITILRSNFEGPAAILSVLANRFAERGSGVIIGISSVAGERGRPSNYLYGSAKSGFTAFLSGLRGRLARQGVHVITVLPGFVATRMTSHRPLPAALTIQPDTVARAIARAVRKGKNRVFVGPVWRLIMAVIRAIPEFVFKRLSL
ncbi:MAG: hypothetical protein RL367_1493 [Pseudomonadota bacterium]